jgi:murein DD-endopeptidase MepM/ murein hydrolase activator NlpD
MWDEFDLVFQTYCGEGGCSLSIRPDAEILESEWAKLPPVPVDLIDTPKCSDLFSLGDKKRPYKTSTGFLQAETVTDKETGVTKTYIHPGMDFPAPAGTPIYLNFTGTLSPQTGGSNPGFGNQIVVFKPTGVPGISTTVVFGHGPTTAGLVPGMTLYPGTQIGTAGSLGRLTTGSHVHVGRTGSANSRGAVLPPCTQ